MENWILCAVELASRDEPAVIVTICAAEGSAPRDPGAKMIVTGDALMGSIGGGALENESCMRARSLLAKPWSADDEAMIFEDYPLGPALGQCCGGHVRIGFDRLSSGDKVWLSEAAVAVSEGKPFILETTLSTTLSAHKQRRCLLPDKPEGGDSNVSFLDASGATLVDPMPVLAECITLRERIADNRASVFLFGAGHVGCAMAHLFENLPAKVTWIDRRADQFPSNYGANIVVDCTNNEVERVQSAPAGACYFVLTHDHQLDYVLVEAILNRGDAAYCGLIGSRTKRVRFEGRLRRAGIDEGRIGELVCPIGGRGLQNKSPAVIALAAVYEMLLAYETRQKEI